MKFTIQRDLFIHELSQALKFTSTSLSSLPSLSGVFIEFNGTIITLKSSNLKHFYTSSFEVTGEGKFTTIFDGKRALEFLNALSSQTVIISLSDSGLLINGGEAQGEFLVYKIENY